MQMFSYERTSLISRYAIVRDVRVAGYLGMKLTEAQRPFSLSCSALSLHVWS